MPYNTKSLALLLSAATLALTVGCSSATANKAVAMNETVTSKADSQQTLQAPLIALEKFFDINRVSDLKSSSDGQWLAFIKEYQGSKNIYLLKAGGRVEQAVAITQFSDSIHEFSWSKDDNRLFFIKDTDGNEQYQIYQLSFSEQSAQFAPKVTRLTHNDKVRYSLIGQAKDKPAQLNVMANHDDPSRSDLYSLNTQTGDLTLLHKNTYAFAGATFDAKGTPVLGVSSNPDNSRSLYANIEGQWKVLLKTQKGEQIDVLRFDSKNQLAYISANIQGRDKSALLSINMSDGSLTEIHKDPDNESDIYSVQFDDDGQVVAASYYGGRLRTYPLTSDFATHWNKIVNQLGTDVEVQIKDLNQETGLWHLTLASDVALTSDYQYNANTGSIELLLEQTPSIAPELLSKRQVVHYKARDGVTIQSYLTLPKGKKSNLATIILPHGGPWARDYWTLDSGYFNPIAQFLANRGYAVLQPNFRASTGLGKRFLNLGNNNWGTGYMQHDLTDGAEYLVSQGIADKQRLGIMGASYGGYAALSGATFTPELYQAVISYVGPSSLITLMESFPAYWRPYLGQWFDAVGDPQIAVQKADIESRSPINFVDRIKAPLLLVQGANDPRVTQVESDNIAKVMAEKSLPVEYILAKDEGHGFIKRNNKLAYILAMEKFFAKHLGGRMAQEVKPELSSHLKSLQVDVSKL